MKLTLKPELQRFVEDQVRAGRFSSTQEVLEAGVARLMLDHTEEELDGETLAAIERAEAEFERGEDRPFAEFAADFRAKHFPK